MPRTGVQFVKNDEPSFIQQFKQRIGHKDEPDVNCKRQIPNFDDDGDDDNAIEKEDEKPVVVVLKEGDLTSEEADILEKERDEGPAHLDRKITFKKPTKRLKECDNKDKEDSSPAIKTKKKEKDSGSKMKKKNTSLLSFVDEENE